MRKMILLMSIFAMPLAMAQQQSSPDGNVVLTFSLKADGTPSYKVTYKNKAVINESTLGFKIREVLSSYLLKSDETPVYSERSLPDDSKMKKIEPLTQNFKVVDTKKSTFKETWKPVWGEESEILNHYNELLVQLQQEKTHRKMNIRFRVYNEEWASAMSSLHKKNSPIL